MAIDFPASPTNGQTFTSGSVTYTWDGTKWTAVAAGGGSSNSISQGNTNATVTDTGSDGRFVVTTEGSERLRVDSSGRLGIGTSSPDTKLKVEGTSGTNLFAAATPAGNGVLIAPYDSSAIYQLAYASNSTSYVIGTQSNIPLALFTGNTERARIDSSGRLLVGTTNPLGEFAFQASNSSKIDLVVSNAASFTGGTNQESRVVLGKTESNAVTPMGIISARPEDPTSGAHGILTFSTRSNGTVSERMRIRADGRTTVAGIMSGLAADTNIDATFRVGATTATGTAMATYSYNDYKACSFIREAAGVGYERGSITVNNSSTAYNTSSDYRLKENVEPVTDGIARLQQLKPSRFNFIADPDNTVDGFIAHEVQDVVPEAIHGQKDAVDADGNPIYQGIDQSKLVPLLTAALQEAVAKIESLEVKVAALESA